MSKETKNVFISHIHEDDEVLRGLKDLLARNGLRGADIKVMIPHQANRRIICGAAERLGLTSEQVIINIDRFGNTTAATIPLRAPRTTTA